MKYLLLLLMPLLIYAKDNLKESFISDYEYGQMLFDNPRGVSCSECHGKNGEGKVIVEYDDKYKKGPIKGADIRKKTLQQMIKSVNSHHKIMPRYYLTNDEVKAIYEYLQKKNAKEE